MKLTTLFAFVTVTLLILVTTLAVIEYEVFDNSSTATVFMFLAFTLALVAYLFELCLDTSLPLLSLKALSSTLFALVLTYGFFWLMLELSQMLASLLP